MEQLFRLCVAQRERCLYLVPMLTGKSLEMVAHHTKHQVLQCRWFPSVDLQQQTLLQRAGTDACRIEALQESQHLLKLFLSCIDVMIHGQLVADGVKSLAKQAVVVE